MKTSVFNDAEWSHAFGHPSNYFGTEKDEGLFIVKNLTGLALNTVFRPLYAVDVSRKLFLFQFFQKRLLLIHLLGLQGLLRLLRCRPLCPVPYQHSRRPST